MDESYAYCSLPRPAPPVPRRDRPGAGRGDRGSRRATAPWSYLGRQILDRGANERTMNFGWDPLRTAREADTAMHDPFPAGRPVSWPSCPASGATS